jgi:hypothetical protein
LPSALTASPPISWAISGPPPNAWIGANERQRLQPHTSRIGKLDKALDEAKTRGWTVVDMKQDWNTVFPPKK